MLKCPSSCASCNAGTSDCASCSSDYYHLENNTKLCFYKYSIITGYLFSLGDGKFNLCDISCYKCETTISHCTQCANNYFAKEDALFTCFDRTAPVPDYTFSSIDSLFIKCDKSCNGCNTLRTKCLNCASNYYPLEDDKSSCYANSELITGYYFSGSSLEFLKCHTSCYKCCGQANYCVQCSNTYYSLEDNLASCHLSPEIIDGYFFNNIFNKCSIECLKCSLNKNNCNGCSNNYYPLFDNFSLCHATTETLDVYVYNGIDKFIKCDSSCAKCSISVNNCDKCSTGYYPLEDNNHSCKNALTIVSGYTLSNSLAKFIKCDISCSECIGISNYCSSCSINYYPLSDNVHMCYNNAPVGYSFNSIINKYQRSYSCYNSCKFCTQPGDAINHQCTTCNDNYYPLSNKTSDCYDSDCKDGYYFNNKKCEICGSSCYSCSKTNKDYCTKCASGYYPLEDALNICLEKVPSGYFLDNMMFKKCDNNCNTCNVTATSCIQCKTSFYKIYNDYIINNLSPCYPQTTPGFYIHSITYNNTKVDLLEFCQSHCDQCSSKTNCTKCSENYFLDLNANCVSLCPLNTYLKDKSICVECQSPCATCKTNSQNCLTCLPGFYGYLNNKDNTFTCVVSCPNNYFSSSITHNCEKNLQG